MFEPRVLYVGFTRKFVSDGNYLVLKKNTQVHKGRIKLIESFWVFLKDKMYESSTSQGVKLGKRPASSSATLEKRSKKRAVEVEEETHGIIKLTVKSQVKFIFSRVYDNFIRILLH